LQVFARSLEVSQVDFAPFGIVIASFGASGGTPGPQNGKEAGEQNLPAMRVHGTRLTDVREAQSTAVPWWSRIETRSWRTAGLSRNTTS